MIPLFFKRTIKNFKNLIFFINLDSDSHFCKINNITFVYLIRKKNVF